MASTPACPPGAISTKRSAMPGANTPATRTGMASARCTSTPSRGSGPCYAPGCDRTEVSRRRSCHSISASSSSCTTHAAAAKPCSAPLSLPWSHDSPPQHPGSQQEPNTIDPALAAPDVATSSTAEADTQQELTDGFHLVIDALKLN